MLSDKIPIKSSVRQGCPLSPLLFALYLEPFCLSILESQNIRGILIKQAEVKVLAYADDVAVFCTDKKSVKEAMTVTEKFCNITGASMNPAKCNGYWYGSWATMPSSFAGIAWDRGDRFSI